MKGNKTGLFGRLNGNVFILLSSILLMSPVSSSSVLCIAPDHVAIEDLDAGCCASPAIAAKENRHSDGFDTATRCRNCTDLFITPNERGPIRDFLVVAMGSAADDCFRDPLWVITSSHLVLQRSLNDGVAPKSASVPIRC